MCGRADLERCSSRTGHLVRTSSLHDCGVGQHDAAILVAVLHRIPSHEACTWSLRWGLLLFDPLSPTPRSNPCSAKPLAPMASRRCWTRPAPCAASTRWRRSCRSACTSSDRPCWRRSAGLWTRSAGCRSCGRPSGYTHASATFPPSLSSALLLTSWTLRLSSSPLHRRRLPSLSLAL